MSTKHAMRPADTAWLRMDRPTNLMVVNGLLWFDAPLDRDRLAGILRERLVQRFVGFRSRAVTSGPLGAACWVEDDDFDLSLHLHRLAIPPPADDATLQELVGDLITRPLDPARPLWEMHLIEGVGAGCAVLVRVHHCIADGIALARVLLSLTGEDEPVAAGTPPAGVLSRARTGAGLVAREGLHALTDPGHTARVAARAARGGLTVARLLGSAPDPTGALKGRQSIAHRVAWTPPMGLAHVKRTARALDATINDVLLTAVSGALAAELARRGEVHEHVHAMVPFNLRPPEAPLDPQLGNHFGLVLLELPVSADLSAGERLARVRSSMEAIKASDEGPLTYAILQAIGQAPAVVEPLLIDLLSAKASLVATNVPGPRRTVALAGVPVRRALVWAPCSGSIGLSVSIFSYAGRVTVGFLSDAGLLPEPARLARDVRDELRALWRSAQS